MLLAQLSSAVQGVPWGQLSGAQVPSVQVFEALHGAIGLHAVHVLPLHKLLMHSVSVPHAAPSGRRQK